MCLCKGVLGELAFHSTVFCTLTPQNMNLRDAAREATSNALLVTGLMLGKASPKKRSKTIRCADCGEVGERTGHMGCQYPQDHE